MRKPVLHAALFFFLAGVRGDDVTNTGNGAADGGGAVHGIFCQVVEIMRVAV